MATPKTFPVIPANGAATSTYSNHWYLSDFTVTSSLVVGTNQLIRVAHDGSVYMSCGGSGNVGGTVIGSASGTTTPSPANMFLPGAGVEIFDTGANEAVAFTNISGGNVNVNVTVIQRN
jgi:hypothetical protein